MPVYRENDNLAVTAAATQWGAMFRLVEAALEAGWSVHEMSDGTTKGTADNWTGNFAGLGASAWIIIEISIQGQMRQVLFARDASSDSSGWVRYAPQNDYDTSGTATAPSNSPTEVNIRGTKGGSSATWLGMSGNPTQAHIFADGPFDIPGSGSWGIVAQPTGNADSAGRLVYNLLEDGPPDLDPFVWWAPASVSSNFSTNINNHQTFLREDGAFWSFLPNGSAFVTWGAAAPYPGWNSGSAGWGGDGTNRWRGGSINDLTEAGQWRLWKIRLMRETDSGVKGRTTRFGVVSSASGGIIDRTFGGGAYAKIGSFLWWPWSDAAVPPGTPP